MNTNNNGASVPPKNSGITPISNSLQADLQHFQNKADELADMIFSYALMVQGNKPETSQIVSHLNSGFKTLKKKLRKIETKRLNGRAG